MKSFTLGQGSLSWKAALLSCSRVSCGCAWKIQGRSLSFAPVRTVNRNRSPRLKASGRQNNVGKGSRQNRSVTSGKGLALRVEYRDPFLKDRSGLSLLTTSVVRGFFHGVELRIRNGLHGLTLCSEQPTQNWSGQGESDCLIKTKHCDGLKRC